MLYQNPIINDVKEIVLKINFNWLQNKKVLITGASGLLGVYLISCLKEIQDEYNLEIDACVNSSISSLDIFGNIFNNINVTQIDLSENNLFTNTLYDLIIHAAGYGQPIKFLENKFKTISVNTTATLRLLNKLNKNGKFLFVSSSEIYSGLDSFNIDETTIGITNTNHPRSCYIEGKRCGESICYSYLNEGYDVKIIRLSLAYGPGTKRNDQRVLNSLIQKALTDQEIKLIDNGEALRTYGYISDVIEMFWNIIFFGKDPIYNVGGKSVTTIYNLAKLIGEKLNKEVRIPEKVQALTGSPKAVNISIDKYQREFNKSNYISLNEGLDKTIIWQKYLYNGEDNT